MVDTQGRPIDFNDKASLEKTIGQPILVCAPVRRAATGRVVDENTKAPVANATVTVESWQTPPPIGGLDERRRLLHSVSTQTDAQGNWTVPAQSDWMPGILAADGLPFFIDSWCVSAPGYETRSYDPWKEPGLTGRGVSEIIIKRGVASPPSNDKSRSTCGVPISAP